MVLPYMVKYFLLRIDVLSKGARKQYVEEGQASYKEYQDFSLNDKKIYIYDLHGQQFFKEIRYSVLLHFDKDYFQKIHTKTITTFADYQ